MPGLPMYQVISRDLRAQIERGALSPRQQLPSEHALAEQYGVSRMTVRQALDHMVADRLLERRRGAGTFVSQSPGGVRQMNSLRSFREDMGLEGCDIRTEMLTQGCCLPSGEVRDRLRLRQGQQVIRVWRLRRVEGTPMSVQDSWLPYSAAPSLAHEDLLDGSLYRTLQERYGIELRNAEQEITAVAATHELAELLEVDAGAPLIAGLRLVLDRDGLPVEYAQSWSRPELRIVFHLEA
jgi:GntR family transcriptional regulator